MAQDVLVSARIAPAKKDAAQGVLGSLGATTSDLINSAFDYLLEKGSLPTAAKSSRPSAEDFSKFMDASSLDIDWGDDACDGDYRSLIRAGKVTSYESLA